MKAPLLWPPPKTCGACANWHEDHQRSEMGICDAIDGSTRRGRQPYRVPGSPCRFEARAHRARHGLSLCDTGALSVAQDGELSE